MTDLLANPLAGVSAERLMDIVERAGAGTSTFGDSVDQLSDAIRAGVAVAGGAVQFTAEQFAAVACLVEALDGQALVAHSAVEDIAEAYSKGVQ